MADEPLSQSTASGKDAHRQAPSGSSASDTPAPSAAGGAGNSSNETAPTVISKRPKLQDDMPLLSRKLRPHELGELLQFKQLGHFQLEEFVGGGGMGAVFRARDLELSRIVAVKVISSDQTDEETVRRFKNEAQSAARLDHKNIARVYYVGEDSGWSYIVFEYIEGVNIRDLVDHKGPLSLDEAINYTLQVAEALAHAAERDVVHRDIKPSNVLVMGDGMVKLVDMGLARLHQVESADDDLTASGVTLGTFDYISPEQARDPRHADVRSDLYSLGCTLFYMLTGAPPFPEGTVLQKLLSHSSDQPPDPRDFRPDLPEEVSNILNRLLAKQPSQRYQKPSELIAELLILAESLGLPSASSSATVWIPEAQPTSRWLLHLPWLVPLVILVAVVISMESNQAPIVEMAQPLLAEPLPLRETSDAPEVPGGVAPPDLPDGSDPSVPATDPAAGSSNSSVPDSSSQGAPPGAAPMTSATGDETGTEPVPRPAAGDGTELVVVPGSTEERPGVSLQPEIQRGSLTWGAGNAPTGAELSVSDAGAASDATLPVDRIVVRRADDDTEAGERARAVESLEQAFRDAATNPDIRTIELRMNGNVPTGVLRWSVDRELTVRAASTFRPRLLFEPAGTGLSGERQMVQVTGGHLTFEGLHFALKVPEVPSDGWALFQVRNVERLDFETCTFTIENTNATGTAQPNSAAVLEIHSEPAAETMMIEDDAPAPPRQVPPVVSLQQCAARGEADFAHAENSGPFTIAWQQGLCVLSRHFLVNNGAASTTMTWDSKVRLDLNQVTAVVDQGLYYADLRSSSSAMLDLDIKLNQCIVLTASDAPVVTHVGVESVERALKTFRLRGGDNFYPRSEIRWRITPRDSAEAVVEFSFDQRDEAWYDEKGASKFVTWKSTPPKDPPGSRPYHLHSVADYELDESVSNPAASAGFDPALLPSWPWTEAELP